MTRIAVIGAYGDVGYGVVRAALGRGWTVTAVGRDATRLRELTDELSPGKLDSRVGGIGSEESAERLFGVLDTHTLDACVTAVNGRRSEGAIREWTSSDLRQLVVDDLLPHFNAAKAASRHMRAGSTYLAVGGGMADVVMRRQGHNAMVQAAQRQMIRAFAKEAGSDGPAIREALIAAMVRGRSTPDLVGPAVLDAAVIGERICDLVALEQPPADPVSVIAR